MSRMASPTKLTASTISMITTPGNVPSHQARVKNGLASLRIEAQVGVRGETPSPEECETGLGENGGGNEHARLDYDRRKRVGEDVLEHHPAVGRAHRPCRRYEVVLLEDEYHSPDYSGEVVHVSQSDSDYNVL